MAAGQGGGVFSAQQVISTAADGAHSVFATDLDGDGDINDADLSWLLAFWERPYPPPAQWRQGPAGAAAHALAASPEVNALATPATPQFPPTSGSPHVDRWSSSPRPLRDPKGLGGQVNDVAEASPPKAARRRKVTGLAAAQATASRQTDEHLLIRSIYSESPRPVARLAAELDVDILREVEAGLFPARL